MELVQPANEWKRNIGIRMVMRMATEVRYFSTFGSNNLVVYLE